MSTKIIVIAANEMGLLASSENTLLCYSHHVILQRHVNVAAADVACLDVHLCVCTHMWVQRLISGLFS